MTRITRRIAEFVFVLAFLAPAVAAAADGASTAVDKPPIVVTIPPLASIIDDLVTWKGQVSTLLPAGASPHTYEPKPSDMAAVERSRLLVFIADDLDGWATKLPAKRKLELFDLLPASFKIAAPAEEAGHAHKGRGDHNHRHGAFDPHFWMDPLSMKAVLPGVVNALCAVAPSNCSHYKDNSVKLAATLDKLHAEVTSLVAPVQGRTYIVTHSFLRYFEKRYGVKSLALLVDSPGKEPSPKVVAEAVKQCKAGGARAVFSEQQQPRRPGDVLAESCGVKSAILDPLGGVTGRKSYVQIIIYNASRIVLALQ